MPRWAATRRVTSRDDQRMGVRDDARLGVDRGADVPRQAVGVLMRDAVPVAEPGAGEESAPPAGGTALLTFEGSGPMTSEPFGASGEVVDLTYEYACTEAASFTLNYYGTYDSPLLPDVLVSEFGERGSGTATESLNGMTGPCTVEVDSPCDWLIEVLGTP